ncbi:MAG: hypothetical protein IPK97_09000 [Ahniella sp.]|nr:hypothetical protein [Ahniella sp.]
MNTFGRGLMAMLVLTIAACGFQLREARPLGKALGHVRIESADPFSMLPQALTRALYERGAKVASGEGASVLKIIKDEALTEPLTIGEAARVQEYRVTLRIEFELRDASGKELLPITRIERRRDYRFDETQALGASAEDERVREELRREQVYAVLRALEAVE